MPTHTISENLQRLTAAKTAISTAITNKGGTVAQGDGLEEFASDIATIPSASPSYPDKWENVQDMVRANATTSIDICDQLVCEKNNNRIYWEVIGKNQDTPVDSRYSHTLTLKTTVSDIDCKYGSKLFCKFYKAKSAGISGNIFKFTYNNVSYYTNPTKLLPNIQIGYTAAIAFNSGVPSSLVLYRNNNASSKIDSYPLTQGSSGTALTSYATINPNYNTNEIQYKDSIVRQYLNSALPSSQWINDEWVLIPSWAENIDGFMYGLDADFLSVIGKTQVISNGEILEDYFFLPSVKQVYGSSTTSEGTAYSFYSLYSDLQSPRNSADTNRIIVNSSYTAVAYRLRTNDNYYVWTDGTVSKSSYTPESAASVVCCNVI